MCAPRSDAADETDRGTLLMSAPCKEEIVLAASSEVGAMGDHGDDGTDQASAFKAEETGECSDVLGKIGEEESTWQVRRGLGLR